MRARDAGDHGRAKKYWKLMNEENSMVTFIRLREGFLEAAPQFALQIYVMVDCFETPLYRRDESCFGNPALVTSP